MASTPSASALSAVLRCRGNILTRNPPSKRPVTQAYSLGLAYGAVRDSTTSERTASSQPASTTWKCFLRGGERMCGGKGALSGTLKSTPLEDKDKSLVGNTNDRGIKNPRRSHSRTCAPLEDTRSYVTGAPNAPVRHARARIPQSTAPGRVESSVFAAYVYAIQCLRNIKELPVLNLSVILPSSKEDGGQMIVGLPLFILNGWSTLKNTCICLSVLVSEIISLNLGVLSCSPDDATEVDEQEKSTAQNVSNVQVKGQIHPSDPLKACSDSRPKSKENRPD